MFYHVQVILDAEGKTDRVELVRKVLWLEQGTFINKFEVIATFSTVEPAVARARTLNDEEIAKDF